VQKLHACRTVAAPAHDGLQLLTLRDIDRDEAANPEPRLLRLDTAAVERDLGKLHIGAIAPAVLDLRIELGCKTRFAAAVRP